MTIIVNEISYSKPPSGKTKLILLPENFNDGSRDKYPESTISFEKYARQHLDVDYLSQPELVVEKRSGEWFGPIIFVSSALLIDSSFSASVLSGVI